VLLQVTAHDFDELFGRLALVRFRIEIGIYNVEADVILENFGHESIDGAPARSQLLQDRATLTLLVEQFLDATDLANNSAYPI